LNYRHNNLDSEKQELALSVSKSSKNSGVSRRHALNLGLSTLAVAGAGGTYFALTQNSYAQAASEDVMKVDPKNDNITGSMDAPVTLVEYSSMTCPHCANFHKLVLPELKEKYIDTGKVRYVLREFPLDRIAFAAAALARCSGEKKFFPFVEMMFRQQDSWSRGPGSPAPRLFKIVKQAGFDEKFFNDCMRNKEVSDRIEKVKNTGRDDHGVNSTPTLFVNGQKVNGVSLSDIEKLMEPFLKG
jgi:protein-disulfide isomerase